ncbi:MAG: MBL fold metallo-hydrolase [Patescibacteria group bacterium]
MKIKLCGAAEGVTGSCTLVETGGKQFLVDCGMFQGGEKKPDLNREKFLFNPAQIEALFLTHAHLDHSGLLPRLVKEGFQGKIFCTKPTVEMAEIVLLDAAKIAEEDARYDSEEPIYDKDDVVMLLSYMQGVEYHTDFTVGPLQVKFYDAGHILGSAIVEIFDGEKRILFSGDLGNYPVLLLNKPDIPPGADAVVVESTYGDRQHEDIYMRKQILKEAVCEALGHGGVVMIPAFAMERTQELLYVFNDFSEREHMCRGNIYLDSPMAHRVTEVFNKYTDYLNEEAKWFLTTETNLFDFPQLKITDTVAESKAINDDDKPKVIIAGSGMMTGGRIKHHLKHYLPDEKNILFVVGYQVAGTLGRALLDGAKEVTIFGEKVLVKAKVEAVGAFSAHADRNRIIQWLASMESLPQQVILNHGEQTAKQSLQQKINDTLQTKAFTPGLGEEVDV